MTDRRPLSPGPGNERPTALRPRGLSPRDLQELCLSVRRTREHLCEELGHEPTARDVAERLGRTPEDVCEAMEAGDAHSPASLDTPRSDEDAEGRALVDVVADPGRDLARSEDGVAPAQLGAGLDDREREVVRLRFQEDLIQREIAERVGCSQMHVSRILRDALAHMRAAAGTAGVAF